MSGKKKFYAGPLTGNESHFSANELLQHRIFQNETKRHHERIKNMKPSIDNTPPRSSQLKHVILNRKKKEMEFQRFSEIERENYRLLDKMSKIMVRNAAESVFGVHSNLNCPALDGEKARERKTKIVLEQNQVLLRRILQTKPYYSSEEWTKHSDKTHNIMQHMCRYPNQVFPEKPEKSGGQQPAKRPDSAMDAHNDSAMSGSGGPRRKRLPDARKLGGATSAPPGGGGAKGKPADDFESAYADEGFEDDEGDMNKDKDEKDELAPGAEGATAKRLKMKPKARVLSEAEADVVLEEGEEEGMNSDVHMASTVENDEGREGDNAGGGSEEEYAEDFEAEDK